MSAAPSRQVITDKHIYRLDSKTFKLHKSPIALDQVTGFSISAGEDQAVVIHIGEGADNDVVATLRGNACAAELVSLIAQQVDKSYVTHALCFPLCFPIVLFFACLLAVVFTARLIALYRCRSQPPCQRQQQDLLLCTGQGSQPYVFRGGGQADGL